MSSEDDNLFQERRFQGFPYLSPSLNIHDDVENGSSIMIFNIRIWQAARTPRFTFSLSRASRFSLSLSFKRDDFKVYFISLLKQPQRGEGFCPARQGFFPLFQELQGFLYQSLKIWYKRLIIASPWPRWYAKI